MLHQLVLTAQENPQAAGFMRGSGGRCSVFLEPENGSARRGSVWRGFRA